VQTNVYAANTDGMIAVSSTSPSTEGALTVKAVGLSSGQVAIGAATVKNNAREIPALVVAPHSVVPGSANPNYVLGARFGVAVGVVVA